MLIRALIVVLLVLNLGVALWWALRASPAEDATVEQTPGVARLQLVSEATPSAATGAPDRPAAAVAIEHCASLGPFADTATADAAAARLQPLVVRVQQRRDYAGKPRSWRVFLPPYADVEQADAAAGRVLAAGFKDYYVIREGADANALALGLFRGESSARERAAALAAAGFPAQVEPVGAGPVEHWLDVGAGALFDLAGAQALTDATQAGPLDCDRLDPALQAQP